ncbi:hypothetical protein [Halostagnicola sp. A-GB9-2]|uniref:hypothetical protein n=1 Tax=Halostagnicola sp. A-GB9-2 TaxID=3048066 RepID=UPI0024C0DB41|nr:hypothetical protein [Halostagnicola sp. A-GB9-2]MDJ1434202.1 hypothetical protein [Halostagnicola sp. A-GB9-2]
MSDYQARQLALNLQTIPPEARLEITWTDDNTETTQTGVVTDHDPETAYRKLETDDRTLELVPAGDQSQITVTEPTATTTHTLGELTAVDIEAVPLFEAPLTDEGFEVPEPLLDLTGYVTVDLPTRNHVINLADHGLQQTDYRLIGNIGTDPDPDLLPDEPTAIRPDTGPHYHIKVIDERTNPGNHEYEPKADDQELLTLRRTVRSLKRATPTTLPDAIEGNVHARFERTALGLRAAHRALCTTGTPPSPDTDPAEDPNYSKAVVDLETELEACMQTLRATLDPDDWQPVEDPLTEARFELRNLQQLLVDVDTDDRNTATTTTNSNLPDMPQWIIEPNAPAPVQRGNHDEE